MEPDSVLLVVLLVLAAAGAIVLVARRGRWWVKTVAGVLSFVLAAAVGTAAVNDYYGYYSSWGQLAADFGGSDASFATTTSARGVTAVGSGEIESLPLHGAVSGIDRPGLVYLPPQYFQARYAHVRFPVVELIHGTPGRPSDYPLHLQLTALEHRLLAHHQAGPTIVVMPDISAGNRFEECVDAPGARDDTYVASDVRHDVLARFRAATEPAEWGIAGYSSGGYCAANLALRHRGSFGAAGLMDAYYRPQDGPAAAALHHDAAAERANDPLTTAAALRTGAAPLPSFWISAGTGDAGDFRAARAFVHALHGVEQLTFDREPGAGHNFYAWRTAMPPMLAWMWTQLAPPALRVQFPVAGTARAGTLHVEQPPVVPGTVRPRDATTSDRATRAREPAVPHPSPSAAASTTLGRHR